MADYQYTQDWFHWAPKVWEQLIPLMPERRNMVELGSFEGRSAVWIVENMLEDGGTLTCVDTWGGGEEHENDIDMAAAEARFDGNIKLLGHNQPNKAVLKCKAKTYDAIIGLTRRPETKYFDFVYIDASHMAPDVLTDACMLWPLVKKDGIVVFDDYTWGNPRDTLHRPKIAVDAFTTIFAEKMSVVHMGYQFIVRKL